MKLLVILRSSEFLVILLIRSLAKALGDAIAKFLGLSQEFLGVLGDSFEKLWAILFRSRRCYSEALGDERHFQSD